MNAILNLQVVATSRRVGAVVKDTQRQIHGLTRSMNGATAAAGRMNMAMRMRNFDRFAKDLQWVGRQIEFNFTLPLLVAGGFAMKWAMDNEKAMTRVRKVYSDFEGNALSAEQELQKLGTTFRLLSDLMGVHQDEVIGIGAAWAQAGSNAAALGRATKLTMETMILGDFGAEDAVRNLIAIQQQYNLVIEDTENSVNSLKGAMGVLNKVENVTAVSFADLTTVFQDAGGVARSAGVDIRTLAAMSASLVPAAADASEAGNGLKTIITRLMAPTNQASQALQALEIDVESSAYASQGFRGRLDEVIEGLQGVSQAEGIVALKHISGIRQVNRLQALYNDLTNEHGKYARAMEETADQAQVMLDYERELTTYLQSDPQKFAILTAQMRNMLTQAIQPLIPYVLELLGAVRDLMRAFIDLPQHQQRMIFYILLFMAVIGPAMRIFGAFGLLISRLGLGFIWLGKAVAGTAAFMSGIVTKFFGIFRVAFIGMAGLISFAASRIVWLGGVFAKTMQFIALTASHGMSTAAKLVGGGFLKMFTMMKAFSAAMLVGWNRLWGRLVLIMMAPFSMMAKFAAGGWRALLAIFTGGFKKLAMITARGFLMVFTSPLGLAIMAAVGLVYLFRDEIAELIQDLIKVWYQLPEGVVGALTAVVEVVKRAALAVYEWLQWMNPFARHSPSLVENVKAGVAIIAAEYASLSNIGTSFRKAINDLKAFNRATADAQAAARAGEFGEQRAATVAVAPGAGDEFDAVVRSIYALETALTAIQGEYDKQAAIVADWEVALENANFQLEAQEMILKSLQDEASALGDELDAAKNRLSALTSTPIEGMQAYSDALFENRMEQQALRLEILRIEEAYGTVEGLQDRMAALSGDIEMLSGQRETLRAAGAGSDVLGALDAQIATLEQERRALNDLDSGPMAEIAGLEQQLADLQKQGEILDLEQSLAFDPLTRQIDQLVNGMEEVPFDVLIQDITATQDEVDRLTQEYDRANEAVARQQVVVDDLTRSRDAIEASYDRELAKLKDLENAYSAIEDQISQMEDALARFAALASASGSGAGEDGSGILGPAGEFALPGGVGGGLEGGNIDALNAELEAELAAMEDLFDLDFMGSLKDMWERALNYLKTKWNDFKGWMLENGIDVDKLASDLGAAFSAFWENVKERMGEIFGNLSFDGIGDRLEGVRRALDPIITAVTEFWDILKGFFVDTWAEIQENWTLGWDDVNQYFEAAKNVWTVIIGAVIGAFTLIWPTVRNVLETVLWAISNAIGGIVQFFSGLIKFIGGIFTLDLGQVLAGLGDMFSGALELIVTIVSGAFQLVWDIISGVVEGIYDFFVWLWDVLVGNSIIPDMVNAIVEWFTNMKNWVLAPVRFMRDKIIEAWNWVKDRVSSAVATTRDNVSSAWNTIKDRVIGKWNEIKGTLTGLGAWLRDFVTKPFQAMRNAVRDVWNSLAGVVSTIWNNIARAINKAIDGIESAVESLISMWNRTAGRISGVTIDVDVDIPNVPTVNVPTSSGSSGGGGGGGYMSYAANGLVTNQPLLTMIGETQGARPEIVTPERLMRQVFADTLSAHGSGGGGGKNITFTGDLHFPNVSDGGDAEDFVRNLEAMVD